ncbi:MAG: ADP-ribosyltransferase [Flavobacteriaceae bacterium]|nr:ADP-ribosyltransferase [Flavobacteriaceae bacterium]
MGYEVRLSNNPKHCPFCSAMAGRYPKDFKFTGWHPNCRCSTIPIMAKDVDDVKEGEVVEDIPNNLKNWIEENRGRIDKTKNKPWWLVENGNIYKNIVSKPNYNILYKNKVFRKNLEEIGSIAKAFPNIDIEELNAINLYTGNYYYDINRYLRGRNVTIDKRQGFTKVFYKKIAETIDNGLEKLPKFKGIVYRGANLPMEVIDLYKEAFKNKGIIVEKAFVSADLLSSVLKNSHYLGNTKFYITSKNGRIIEKISKFNFTEKEVLFKSNTKFKITNFVKSEDNYLIVLQEL